MVQEFFIHPSIAIPVVVLTILTFLLKARRKKFFKAHYAFGIITVSLTAVAIFIAVRAVTPVGIDYFPDPAPIHAIVALPAATSIFIQGTLGIMMLLSKRRTGKLYRIHRRLARIVVILLPVQGALGLTVLYFLYQRYY